MGKKKVSLFTKDVLAAAGSSFSEAEMPRAHFCALGWILPWPELTNPADFGQDDVARGQGLVNGTLNV